jgi:hypothetical protein
MNADWGLVRRSPGWAGWVSKAAGFYLHSSMLIRVHLR